MAAVKLGNRPKNFPAIVSFPMLDGSEGSMQVTFKYRTKREFGAFIDSLMLDAGVKVAEPDSPQSLAELMEKTIDKNAHYIMQTVEGWNLDEPFGLPSVTQLCDEIPGAAQAIMEKYRVAINEGRLGN